MGCFYDKNLHSSPQPLDPTKLFVGKFEIVVVGNFNCNFWLEPKEPLYGAKPRCNGGPSLRSKNV